MRTKSLFHFTSELETLFSILKNGFWPRISFEDISWVGHDDFYGNPMVCFCDIALSKLSVHTSFYGNYGIGMTREWGINNGLNPLMYISSNSILSETLNSLMSNAKVKAKADAMITLLYTKPLFGQMLDNGNNIEKNFYEECEWRYLDTSLGGIFRSDIKDINEVDIENDKTLSRALKFKPSDIRYILVNKENDVIRLIDFINSHLGEYSHNELKVMTTKIVILEELGKDI